MARIKVAQEVKVYEVNEEEVGVGKEEHITVDSHWNRREFVVIGFGDKKLTVVGNNLQTAIENAQNTGGV